MVKWLVLLRLAQYAASEKCSAGVKEKRMPV